MKRLLTIAIALVIASVAFGQKKTTGVKDPLNSELNYKHPFAAKKAKENNIGATEKFTTRSLVEAQDYKHPKTASSLQRVYIRQGSGANSAASTKHPLD